MIAVNNAYELAPFAEILYACDFAWWERHAGAAGFKGVKLCGDAKAARRGWAEKIKIRRNGDLLNLTEPGTVGWGGNSGFHALNLAIQFGARRILLLGFDMRVDLGLHWHGAHPQGMNNPSAGNAERWRRALDDLSEVIAALGVEIVNCSPVSALRNYPKLSLPEALECLSD